MAFNVSNMKELKKKNELKQLFGRILTTFIRTENMQIRDFSFDLKEMRLRAEDSMP